MRFVLGFLCLFAMMPRVRGAEVEFVRVWPGWRDADTFDRISEYFGGPEVTGKQIVRRTQPEARAGYYFLLRVKTVAALPAAKFEVDVIRATAPDVKKYTFPVALPAPETVVQLGLTGAEWPEGRSAHPVAWRVVLLAADGHVLAERKSFLWEKPAK
jgi:hypothetical protein